MQFNSFTIHLESDGFRIENPSHNVPNGTPLVAYYELPSGWEAVNIFFEPIGWSILHPFTHSGMFIYTGQEPIRVIIKLSSRAPLAARQIDDDEYPAGTLGCYPIFSDEIWFDGSLQNIGNPSFSQTPPPLPDDASQPVDDGSDDQPLPTHFGGIAALEADAATAILENPDPESAPSSGDSVLLENPDPSDPNAY